MLKKVILSLKILLIGSLLPNFALAVDNYDPATKILTIDAVTLGDTKYLIVTVRLDQFQVLVVGSAIPIDMKITAQDLMALGVIDGIIEEPMGGAHRAPEHAVASVGAAIAAALDALDGKDEQTVRAHRRERFYRIGRVQEAAPKPAAKKR